MAETTAKHAADGTPLSVPDEPPVEIDRPNGRLSVRLLGLWLALSTLLLGFLLFGTVRVDAGTLAGLQMSPARIWSRFVEYLADRGASPGLVVAVSAAVLVAIAGSILLVYLSFGLRNSPEDPGIRDREAR